MYRLVELSERGEAEWEDFARTHGTTFHSLAWKRILERSFGYRGRYLTLRDASERIAGLLPVMLCRDLRLRRVAVSLPFVNDLDPCARDDAARAALIECLSEVPARLGASDLEVRLRDPEVAALVSARASSVHRGNATFLLPLHQGEESLLAACRSSHRNHVRKAYRRGSFRAEVEGSDVDEFFRVYSARQKQLGTPVPSPRFYHAVRAAFPSDAVVLTVREAERDRVVAGMFLLGSGDTLHYLWGGGDVAYNRMHVNAFMYWEALRCGIARGYRWLDLGRSPRTAAHGGAYTFKMQFGVEPLPLTYCRVASAGVAASPPPVQGADDRAHLSAAAAIWKRLPDAVTAPLGRLLIRYVIP